MSELDAEWSTVDGLWAEYVRTQERDLLELQESFETLDRAWSRSECPFDADPLGEDWTETNPQAGPLRTNQEENWSQWLAHLVRSSSGAFTRDLLGEAFDTAPTRVRCELTFRDADLHDRRVDVLVEFADRGLSIEVKVGDENYRKTPQTAYLTETHHPRDLDWTHLLLLPERKCAALAEAFSGRITDGDGRPTISATGDHEADVDVVHWQEVSRALRRTLLAGAEGGAHWAASAYLFTALVEQQIARFHPAPAVEDYLATSLGVSGVERLRSLAPGAQVAHLDRVVTDGG